MEISVYRCCHQQCDPRQLQQFHQWLTPEEAARRLRYRRPQDQLRFLVGRGMLRTLLQRYTGVEASRWQFELGPYGRPDAVCGDAGVAAPRFSLSHSRGTSIAAFSFDVDEVGADVEARDRMAHADLARRYFAPTEAEVVEQATETDRGELFLRFWTLKEAYVKAVGQGISLGLDTFAFSLRGQLPPTVSFASPGNDPSQWHFYEQSWDDQQIAVAARLRKQPEISPARPEVSLTDFV